MTGIETSTNKKTETVELICSSRTDGELALDISLYRLTLKCGIFYLISSNDTVFVNRAAAETITSDSAYAHEIYRKIVRGSVPPETLHEIISDIKADAVYNAIC